MHKENHEKYETVHFNFEDRDVSWFKNPLLGHYTYNIKFSYKEILDNLIENYLETKQKKKQESPEKIFKSIKDCLRGQYDKGDQLVRWAAKVSMNILLAMIPKNDKKF